MIIAKEYSPWIGVCVCAYAVMRAKSVCCRCFERCHVTDQDWFIAKNPKSKDMKTYKARAFYFNKNIFCLYACVYICRVYSLCQQFNHTHIDMHLNDVTLLRNVLKIRQIHFPKAMTKLVS